MRTIIQVNEITSGGTAAALLPWDVENGNSFPAPLTKVIVVLLALQPANVTIEVPILIDGDLKVADRVISLQPGVPFLWPLDRMEVYRQVDGNVNLDFSGGGSIGIWLV